jgi:hypothetical protein
MHSASTTTMIASAPSVSTKRRPGAMRLISAAAAAFLMLHVGVPAWSQEWALYLAFDDLFSIDFPGEPAISTASYTSESGAVLPARVYKASDEFGTYTAMAVDWSTAEAQHESSRKKCLAGTGDLRGGENPGICGNRTRNEIGGAIVNAAGRFIQRGGKLIHMEQSTVDGVESIGLELRNADRTQTFAMLLWHEGRLYIAEATAPEGAPPPSAFTASIQFLDKEGRRIQYGGRYSPLFPVPKRNR